MKHRHPVIRGTLILTAAGLISRFIGFFYRIFLSQTIGAEGMGIYQLIFPVYTLCFALTVFGIQTAISRYVAACLAKNMRQQANDTFLLGCLSSILLSAAAAFFVYRNADFIGTVLLSEERTAPLLQLLSFSIPISAFHTCVNAYYYARNRAEVPAASQLLEQFARVGTSFVIYQILLSQGAPVNAVVAVAGILGGELSSMVFCGLVISWDLHGQNYRLSAISQPLGRLSEMFRHSLPLTANRLMLTLLTSLEHVMIPSRLQLYGLGSADALSLFGILTGMAMPLLMFPATITNSVSVMLLPSVARKQAQGEQKNIQKTISMTVRVCLMLGCACLVVFFLFGPAMGKLIFHNSASGQFLHTLAFVCPFLYLNSTLISILNGLGQTTRCFLHNLASLAIRIGFTFFGIPVYGIKGYLWGILLGELVLTVLNLSALKKYFAR